MATISSHDVVSTSLDAIKSHELHLKVVITYASHVCSQHSFGIPLRMNGIHRTLFDHACFDHLIT